MTHDKTVEEAARRRDEAHRSWAIHKMRGSQSAVSLAIEWHLLQRARDAWAEWREAVANEKTAGHPEG